MTGGAKPWEYSFTERDSFRDRQRASQLQPERPTGRGPQRQCARGSFCLGKTTELGDDEQPVTTPALTHETFCSKCRNAIWRALDEIPELWVRLHQELGSKGQASERVTMSRSAPLPLRADIDALLREHLDILASWDERVRIAASLVLPDTQETRLRADHGRMVAAHARTLKVHLDTLLALPADAMSRSYSLHDLAKIPEGCHGRTNRIGGYAEVTVELGGEDAGGEILQLHYRTRSVLGETRMTERLDVPCPDPACDLLMLERRQGSAYEAECRACGRLLSASEYESWVKLYAATMSTADLDRARASRLSAA